MGRKDAMKPGEMGARWWNEGREATQEIDRLERELGSPVAQGTLEREHDPSARIEREPRVGDRRSRAIAGQPLEAVAIIGVDEAIGVERVAVEECGSAAGLQ